MTGKLGVAGVGALTGLVVGVLLGAVFGKESYPDPNAQACRTWEIELDRLAGDALAAQVKQDDPPTRLTVAFQQSSATLASAAVTAGVDREVFEGLRMASDDVALALPQVLQAVSGYDGARTAIYLGGPGYENFIESKAPELFAFDSVCGER